MSGEHMPFEADFVAGSGALAYQEAAAWAVALTGSALADPKTPGLVDGYAGLKAQASSLGLDEADGVGLRQALREAVGLLADRSASVASPAYLAHLHCPPTIASLAAEMLVSGFNQSMDSFDQAPAATAVEQHVVESLCAKIGYGPESDGVFTSGGTQSNLQALLMARDAFAAKAGWSIAERGLPLDAGTWRVLCAPQAHFSIRQALRVLGLGANAVLEVPADPEGRMDAAALAALLDECASAKVPVFALVLTAGTTDSGAVDPLAEAASLAREHGVWTHVDACAGGCLVYSERRKHLLRGIELADSVAVDFHKLLFQAISCSALLVRERESFAVLADHADYLNPEDDSGQDVRNLVDKSLQTTRRFDALKVLVTLRALGSERVGAMIEATCAAAEAAGAAVVAADELELLAPVATNTVIFRWRGGGSEAERDSVTAAVRAALAKEGTAVVGRSRAFGQSALKLTFVNPLVTEAAARYLVGEIARCARRLSDPRTRKEAGPA
ncbi:pyridoxal phosphate-dependent decarboxylase family protein [Segniliparus rugosus]|uniref:L-2,4-diaminobutyrate decarboxylase n=1 Tax=Segniliparus rugosus (strain ATCC BAA-974 / DSM 45345 / CCUG 50838 / CIP 108380 / JCM 13579 / CDC 945) TaxID=679197 RepID=E5XKU6_SEGRC|nr:pyridoxal-dependent decarboxylase [Segniliparus rugosus]EFV15031.1 hypothetical protein HMPREF9336_00115 [Segniliparus rugosus ATCC BAA-974]